MAGKEEVEAARRWVMSPCTAAKSTDGAAAGDDGPVMRMRFPSKRKAASGSIYKVGEPLPADGCVDLAGEGDLSALHRREPGIDKMLQEAKLPAAIKQGTDANAAVKQSADASVVVKQGMESSAAPAAAACGSKGKKYRLKKSELRAIFALRPEPFPPADDYLELAPFFPPGWLEQKKREEEEDAALFARMDAELEAFRQQVIEGVRKNGYFEVDEDPSEGREEANEYSRQEMAEIDFSELRLLDAGPNALPPKVIPYVPNNQDEDVDALLDDIPSDDDLEEDDALLSNKEDLGGEAADAHKLVPPIQSS